MATFDHPSDLVHRITYPTVQRPGLRIDSRVTRLPAEEEKQPPVRCNLQGTEVGDIFYFIEPRPRNPWAALGPVAFLSVLLLALIVAPLYRPISLLKRHALTMLYLPSPPVAVGISRSFRRLSQRPNTCLQARPFPHQCKRRRKRRQFESVQVRK